MKRSGRTPREAGRLRLAILVNTIAPYRLPIYAWLAESMDTLVMHGGSEANRSWQLDIPPSVKTKRVWTLQLPVRKKTGVTGISASQYMHFNLGLLWSLPRFRPHAILTNELGLRTIIALVYGRFARVPVWVQWEGTPHSERNVSRWKKRARLLLARHAQRWISYGASSTEYLRNLHVSPERVLEVQNCVPHENFLETPASSARWFEGDPGPVILSVGQFIPRKGLNKLVEACGRLAARGIAFTLVLVGHGPERERLQTQAERAGIKHFHTIANQSQKALNELYHRANVFVFPTLEDVWGLVVNEALWSGLPVLCSRYAGCAEIVAEENLFDPLSAESFDAALAKALKGEVLPPNPQLLRRWQEVAEAMRRAILEGAAGDASHHTKPEPVAGW